MKKNYVRNMKKTLSVFMAVLMLLSAWVFVAPEKADALSGTYYGKPEINGSHFNSGTTAQYNTPVFNGTLDRWFKWQNGDDWTTVYYPSHIYLDKKESLQSAGYYMNVQWHFGDGSKYRILLGANVWGDNSAFDSYGDGRINTMNNVFDSYSVDASCTDYYYTYGDGGLYNGGSNYDLRIVGYGYDSTQGTDGFDQNGLRHEKYVLLRSRSNTNNATIYLKGSPKSDYIGKTTAYNTSGGSYASYGLAQTYNSGKWSTHSNGAAQFNSKGSSSSYMEGEWIEMAWDVTVYDKEALNNAVSTAYTMLGKPEQYSTPYLKKLQDAYDAAYSVLIKRETNQTEIDNVKNNLQSLINAPEIRTYDVTFENMFSLSEWRNSESFSYDTAKGEILVESNKTIKIYKSITGSELTTGSSYPNAHGANKYSMPVTGGEAYTVRFNLTASANGSVNSEVFLFWYDSNNNPVNNTDGSNTFNNKGFSGTGTHSVTFTAPANAAKAEIRFDNDCPEIGATLRFNDIAVYPAARAAEYDIDNWSISDRVIAYDSGTDIFGKSLPVPERKNYVFNGWYLDNNGNGIKDTGEEVTDANGTVTAVLKATEHKNLYADWRSKTLDIGYDNIFSLSDWSGTTSVNSSDSSRGEVKYDLDKGTITVNTTSGGEVYTTYNSDGYTMTVEPETEYIFKADVAVTGTASDSRGQMFTFFYDGSGSSLTGAIYDGKEQTNPHIGIYPSTNGTHSIVFTTPANCTKLRIRVGATAVGDEVTYSNIAVVKKDAYDAYAKNYNKVRETFVIGDTKELSLTPTRDGWVFNGWVDSDNNPVTSVAGYNSSDVVYATWTKLWTVTFLKADGTVLVKRQVKTGEAAEAPEAPAKTSDASGSYTFTGWDTDFTNVQSDITVAPQYQATPHGNFKYTFESPATCTQNAMVIKKCGDCNYSFGVVEYDGTENTAWLYTGHSFTGAIIANSYVGSADNQTDTDTHERKCSKCDATTTETHANSWVSVKTEGATCSVNGTVYWECGCGAKKTTTGDKAPTVHVNTTKINAQPATCTADGKEADTYCEDCDKIIATGKTIPQTGHSFTTYTSNDDATCTADGTKTATCDNCTATDTLPNVGSAKGHDWKDEGDVLVTVADCENDAVYYQTCDTCGISAKDDTTGTGSTWTAAGTKLGHNYTDEINSLNNGKHNYLCKNGCGTYGFEGVKDAYTDCTYGEWSKTEEAAHTKTCTACNYSVTENHQWSAWASTNIYNEGAGEQTRSCSVCGREETTGCNYETTHMDATCTTSELTTYTCKDCGHGYTVTGEGAKGHDYTDADNVKSYNGYHSYLCKNGCGTYGFAGTKDAREACSYSYAQVADGQHKATCNTCGYNYTQGCSVGENGTEATCSSRAVCGQCGEEFGVTASHNFTAEGGVVTFDDEDKHAYRCEYCKDENKYGIGENENYKQDCSGGKATCSALAECTVCKLGHGELDESAHAWDDWQNIEGTLEHQRVCKNNPEHTQKDVCFSTSPAVASPDCNTPGFTLNTCEDCGHTWETDPVAALGHSWSSWAEDGNGNHTRTCTRGCGYPDSTETKPCADADPVVKTPTCTEDGYTTYTCDDCGYVWTADPVSATGHSYVAKRQLKDAAYKRTDKNCTTDETYWYMCDNCDVSAGTEEDKYDDITALYWMPEGGEKTGHKFNEKCGTYLATPATCEERATYYYSCSNANCTEKGTETYKFGSNLGHDWVKPAEADLDKYNVIKADCVTEATYYYVCGREGCGVSSEGKKTDGETWTDVGSKTGHDFEGGYTAYVAPTCSDAGVKEHWTCQVCDRMYADKDDETSELASTAISKLSHKWESVAAKAATCEEDGHTKYDKCTREGCNEKSGYEVIPAKGHEFLAANGYFCDTVYNYHAYNCTNCDAIGVDGVVYSIDASGLDPEIKGGIKCTFDGEYVNYEDENNIHSHKLICECGNETGDVCYDAEPEKVAPTCTDDGYYKHICDRCGYEWTVASDADEDKAEGHNLVASSNGNRTHTKACSKCNYKEAAEACTPKQPGATCGNKEICEVCNTAYGDPVAHIFTNYVYDEGSAQCQKDGTKTAKCDFCDATDTVKAEGTALDHVMTEEWSYDLSGWDGIPADFDADSIYAPNCHEEGIAIIYCTNEDCSYYKTKTVPADPSLHQWKTDAEGNEEWELVYGDCGTGVTLKNVCSVEGCKEARTKTETVEHTWEVIGYIAPTCVQDGFREYRCTVCRQTEGFGYDKDKHEECIENGVEYAEADLKKTEIHSYVTVSETPATCNRNAYITEKCTVCNGYHITEIEGTTLDHNFVEYKGVDATCEAEGYTAYQKCADCGTEEGKAVIPATGHGEIGEDGKCEECNRVIYDSESGASCGCICHMENGLMKLLYKILNFFWKLFKIGKTCDCGNVHW